MAALQQAIQKHIIFLWGPLVDLLTCLGRKIIRVARWLSITLSPNLSSRAPLCVIGFLSGFFPFAPLPSSVLYRWNKNAGTSSRARHWENAIAWWLHTARSLSVVWLWQKCMCHIGLLQPSERVWSWTQNYVIDRLACVFLNTYDKWQSGFWLRRPNNHVTP